MLRKLLLLYSKLGHLGLLSFPKAHASKTGPFFRDED